MPTIIASAAAQQPAMSSAGAFNHLTPVVDLLARSIAKSKSQQGAGARRWPMLATLVRRAYAGAKALLALIGLVAVAGVLLLVLQKDGIERLPAWASGLVSEAFSVPATEVAGTIQPSVETPLQREQRVVTEYIAKRYRVSEGAIAGYVAAAYRAGEQHSVDPLLILAVRAVESRYNPVAESVVGAQILREYQRRFRDTETALQVYAGAFDEPRSAYANKVFAERARLELLRQKARKQPQSA